MFAKESCIMLLWYADCKQYELGWFSNMTELFRSMHVHSSSKSECLSDRSEHFSIKIDASVISMNTSQLKKQAKKTYKNKTKIQQK